MVTFHRHGRSRLAPPGPSQGFWGQLSRALAPQPTPPEGLRAGRGGGEALLKGPLWEQLGGLLGDPALRDSLLIAGR